MHSQPFFPNGDVALSRLAEGPADGNKQYFIALLTILRRIRELLIQHQNQSKRTNLKAQVTSKHNEARVKADNKFVIDSSFASDLLRGWGDFSTRTLTRRSSVKPTNTLVTESGWKF